VDNTTMAAATAAEPGRPRRRGPGRLGRWLRPAGSAHVYWVGGLTVFLAAVYTLFSCVLYYTYREDTYDLVLFDQAIRSYAHFQPGISAAKGMHNFGLMNFSILGDHFSPIDALLAPLYWIYDSPVNLLVAQGVLFALAVPPVWVFTRRAFGGGRHGAVAAYCVSVAYGLSWPIAAALAFCYHEVAFEPVLGALALERLQKGRWKTALVMMCGLLLVKEDMGLYVAGLGLGLAVTRNLGIPRQRLMGLVIAVVALVYTFLAIYVFIPAMGGKSGYYWAYDELGPNVPSVVKYILLHPFTTARIVVTPSVKLSTLLKLFAPFLFLSFLSPIAAAAVPLLLERMLGVKFPTWWGSDFQYNAYVIVPIILAAVDGALRLDRWVTWAVRRWRGAGVRWRRGALALCCTVTFAVVTVAQFRANDLSALLHRSFYSRTGVEAAEAAAAAHVPSGVLVAAANTVGPHLDTRDTVVLWDGARANVLLPWVVASVDTLQFSFNNLAGQRLVVAELQKKYHYVTVFSRDGFIVMHAPGTAEWKNVPVTAPG
jgi:uncharacterized membrane protein